SDVDGVYTADPRIVTGTRRLSELSHEEMQELALAGAKVLNAQAVEFARDRGITIHARSTFVSGPGTLIKKSAVRELRISGAALGAGRAAADRLPGSARRRKGLRPPIAFRIHREELTLADSEEAPEETRGNLSQSAGGQSAGRERGGSRGARAARAGGGTGAV